MKLWVDDLREPPRHYSHWAKNSQEAIEYLADCQYYKCDVTLMSLDHDLGGLDTTRPVVLWCCEHNFWPTEVRVHTANPVGRQWLEGMIERYMNEPT